MTSEERRRAAWLCLLAFAILGSYECVRAATESLFITRYGVRRLPHVWAAVPVGAAVAVAIYNQFAARVRLMRLMSGTAFISLAVFLLVNGARSLDLFGATFILYVVKDVYVVILVEIFWSYANAVFPIKTARSVYGIFCMAGSAGGAGAAWLLGQLAQTYGTGVGFWMQVPILLAIGGIAALVPSAAVGKRKEHKVGLSAAPAVLKKSPYLLWMLLLIATTQVVITLVDFSYNAALEQAYPDTDARTGVISNVYFAINAAAVVLQLATGRILALAGVPMVLFAVPLLLGSSLAAFVLLPRFILLATSKVLSKCLDYSLFRAAKEILYIPLSYEEKTQGKSVVDMLTYRFAKGGASLLLILLAGLEGDLTILLLTLGLVGVWLTVTWVITGRYRAIVQTK